MKPQTASPTLKAVAAGSIDTISPAKSRPVPFGNCLPVRIFSPPERMVMSTPLTLLAATRTRAWSGFNAGIGICRVFSTSAGP
jgi:hypothetical protein